jgi:proteasome lid subunit RPN8/RPN11
MFAHARAVAPAECCGLVGGRDERAETVYRLQNIAADPLTAYEGAPGELFAAQRAMRVRGEELIAIYHSHPQAQQPVPSATDVRLAFYPAAVYFIISLGADAPVLGAFRIYESEKRWEQVEYRVCDA